MRKFLIPLVLLAVVFFISVVSAQTINTTTYSNSSTSSGITITQLRYTPYPANPGEYIDVWVQAQFYGTNYPSNATFVLEPKFPFSLDPTESAVQSFGSVGANVVVLHYKVKIDSNAVPGENELDLAYSPDGINNIMFYKPLYIDVENAQTNFEVVVQGSSSSGVSLGIANIGENTANSLIAKIPSQPNYKIAGVTNAQILGNLNSGDYTLTTFDVSQVNSRNSTLEVELDYTDAIGVRRNVIEDVNLNPGSDSGNSSYYAATGIASGNLTGGYGRFNSSSGNFAAYGQRMNFNRKSSITSNPWFWIVIGIIVIIVGASVFITLIKKRAKKKLLGKTNNEKEKIKKPKEKENSKEPDWVTSERKKR